MNAVDILGKFLQRSIKVPPIVRYIDNAAAFIYEKVLEHKDYGSAPSYLESQETMVEFFTQVKCSPSLKRMMKDLMILSRNRLEKETPSSIDTACNNLLFSLEKLVSETIVELLTVAPKLTPPVDVHILFFPSSTTDITRKNSVLVDDATEKLMPKYSQSIIVSHEGTTFNVHLVCHSKSPTDAQFAKLARQTSKTKKLMIIAESPKTGVSASDYKDLYPHVSDRVLSTSLLEYEHLLHQMALFRESDEKEKKDISDLLRGQFLLTISNL
jgi:hypothetical protein